MITSSLSPRWKSLDLNSAPITGTSPIHGRAFVVEARLLQQPGDGEALAAAQLDRRLGAPHGQRRDRQRAAGDGTLTAPLVVSWLTSGRTRRLSRVGDITVGTTARLTPNVLNSTVMVVCAVGGIAGDRDRELAAGQEARGLAGQRREVRLRQDGDQLIGRQRVDDAVDVPRCRR